MLDGKGNNAGGAQRLRNTLLAAMGMAGYGTKQAPEGRRHGRRLRLVAGAGDRKLDRLRRPCRGAPSGEVKVKKLTVATDVGTQVHPDNIRAQVEGAALWGLSLAMYEKATLKDGGIEQTNFDTYTPLRMSQMPEVAVNVIANGEKATGVGEPAVTVIAPALGNAIFNACRRPRPLAADHGGGGEGGDEGVRPSASATRQHRSAGGFSPADFFVCSGIGASVCTASRRSLEFWNTGSSAFTITPLMDAPWARRRPA